MHTNNLLGLLTAPTRVGSGDLLGGWSSILLMLLLIQLREHLLDIFGLGGGTNLTGRESAWFPNLALRYHRHRLLLWGWCCGWLAAELRASARRQDLLGFELPGESFFLLVCHKIITAAEPEILKGVKPPNEKS